MPCLYTFTFYPARSVFLHYSLILTLMDTRYEASALVNNTAGGRFEMEVEGATAFIKYKNMPDAVALLHTEVPPALEGRGVAAALVEKTFMYLEERNQKIVPLCPYVAAFLKRQPEWNKIIA